MLFEQVTFIDVFKHEGIQDFIDYDDNDRDWLGW